MLKILLLSSSFICTRLSDQKISSSPFFQKFYPKNEAGDSYKKDSYKKTVYSQEKFVTIWPGDIGGGGSTRFVTNGGGRAAKITNFAVT